MERPTQKPKEYIPQRVPAEKIGSDEVTYDSLLQTPGLVYRAQTYTQFWFLDSASIVLEEGRTFFVPFLKEFKSLPPDLSLWTKIFVDQGVLDGYHGYYRVLDKGDLN